MMSTPPGWYPEPTSPTGQRYWNGEAWTTFTTPAAPTMAPPPLKPTPAAQLPSYTPVLEAPDGYGTLTASERDALPRNPLATTGMWMAIASGVLSFTLLLQLSALALSIVGLIRSRRICEATGVAVGRTKAIVGICLSAVSTLWFFVVVIPGFIAWFTPMMSPVPFDRAATEGSMLAWSDAQGLGFTDVSCPASPSMVEGNTFTCAAMGEDGLQYAINVEVQEAGYLTWQLDLG